MVKMVRWRQNAEVAHEPKASVSLMFLPYFKDFLTC